MFESVLPLWAKQPLVPDPPDSVRGGLPLVTWITSLISHWLTTPTISVPYLSQDILQAKLTVGGGFSGWVGIPDPSLGAFLVTKDDQTSYIFHC